MTKILHLTYDMRIGGTEMVIKNLIEGNTDATFDMSIYCIESPIGPWGEELKNKGVQISGQAREPGFDVKLIRAIRQHIKSHHIDIIHCHQYTPWVYGALAAAKTKTKVIFTEHGRFYPDASSWKRAFINPFLLKLTSRITAISKATKQALVDFEFIPCNRIDVVYNGIKGLKADICKQLTIKQLGLPEGVFVFGTVARLDPIKNQSMMVKAFAKVATNNPTAYLVIVGDGEMRPTLELLVEQLQLRDKVIFTGYQPNPEALINAFDVFLLSSFSEGTSMTLLEAMSLGKPCVVTDAGGNAEVIKHNYCGLVCENDDEEAFAKACFSIMTADFERYRFHCQERFDSMFSVATMHSHFSKIWNSVC